MKPYTEVKHSHYDKRSEITRHDCRFTGKNKVVTHFWVDETPEGVVIFKTK